VRAELRHVSIEMLRRMPDLVLAAPHPVAGNFVNAIGGLPATVAAGRMAVE